MTERKFERSKPHVNIGEIAERNVDLSTEKMDFVSSTIDFVMSNQEEYNKIMLQSLIKQYGEEEGIRRFEMLKEQSAEIFGEIQKLGMEPEERTSGFRR